MTTLFDSSSSGAEESSMDDNSHGNQTVLHLQKFNQTTRRRTGDDGSAAVAVAAAAAANDGEGGGGGGGGGDMEIWENFTQSFCQVQKVLDQNRVLIQQVNENHQSKIPDNLAKNVALIREINGNISKVVSLYSDLSTNFSSVFHQRREIIKDDKAECDEVMDRSISVISTPSPP